MPEPISLLDQLPAPEVSPEALPPAPAEEGIPDEVLALPAFNSLLTGATPAVAISRDDPAPESAVIARNKAPLEEAGFGFYPAQDKSTVVFFNSQSISLEELQKADKAGDLASVVTPFAELKQSYDSAMGGEAPPPTAGEVAAPETPPSAPPPPAPASGPTNVSLDKRLATARLKSVAPGSPTSGPKPGAGRILNALMKPVV